MLSFANVAASIVTTRKGAIRSMPDREEVGALLANYGQEQEETKSIMGIFSLELSRSLDVIVNYYFYLAEKEKTEFVVSGKLTGKLQLDMFDITTLMGNILQNAMEATAKAAVPKIRVELVEHKKEIFIAVSNSVAEKISTKNGFLMTSKKDKENHGFGLKNIAAVVEKYHGGDINKA